MIISSLQTENNLIEIQYQSDDCIDDLFNCFHKLLILPQLPTHLLLLSNAYNCNFKITYEEAEAVTKLMQLLSNKCNFIKHAIISDNPKHTAMMSLAVEKLKNTYNYNLKLFCTKEAAHQFLLPGSC